MKRYIVIFLVGLFSVTGLSETLAQQPTCEGNSYSSEIISKKIVSETCVEYEIKVSYDGTRSFGLSHFTMAIPCGEIRNVSNSENWKQVFGKDPTTGVDGLKIDNINGFGENGADSFTIKFTWCVDATCNNELGVVAYKAGQCIDYDTLKNTSVVTNGDDSSNGGSSCGEKGNTGSDKGNHEGDKAGKGKDGNNMGGDKENHGNDKGNNGKDRGNDKGEHGSDKGNNSDSGGDDSGSGDDGGTGTGDGINTGSGGDGTGTGTGTGGGTPSDSTSTTCSTLIAKLQKTNVSCFGGSNGQLQVVIQDGLAPYTYAWSTGETTSSIMNLVAGSYSVTVMDANSNTMTLSEIISGPQAIVLTETITNPSCSGSANGSINLSVTGGSGTFVFAWNNGSTQQNLIDLASGSYTVVVTDSAGCVAQKTVSLINTTVISAGVTFTHPTCSQSNGTIDITPSGGVSPYTYLWSTGATTQDLQNGGPGTYTVKITDANGCSVDKIYALRINNTLSLTYLVTPTSCLDDASGAINLSVSGGTAPYTYLWQDAVTTEDRSGLTAGVYKVTVTDAGGCSSTLNISVFKKTLQVTSSVTQPTCAGDLGSITVTPVDGVAPYTYLWSTGDTTNSITDVTSGSYSVTITDASGCSKKMNFVMPSLLAISATNIVSNTQCGSEGAYAIDLTVAGGKSPYTFVWSNSAMTEDISGLNSGTYSVSITDANGCSASQEIVVSPILVSWDCLINQPTSGITCKSAGNTLSTSVIDATTYNWSVTSSDNSWVITAGSNASSVVYTAGNTGISATFTLTITKDGCAKTCIYTTSTSGCVVKDNTGGGDPSTGDPCAVAVNTTTTPSTTTTTPADTTATTTSDPAATETNTPSEESETATDDTQDDPSNESSKTELNVCAFPNPFTDRINFEWNAPDDDYLQVEVCDALGRVTSVVYCGNVQKGQSYKFDWTPTGPDKVYIYRYKSSKKAEYGKLIRR